MPTSVAGTAAVKFVADTSGLNAEIARQVNPLAKSFGGKFGKALGPVMAQQSKHLQSFTRAAKYASIGAAGLAAYGIKDVVDAGKEFEKQMSVNSAISEANGKQMAALEKQSIKLGQATFYSAKQAAEAQGELIKGGLSVKQTLGGGLAAALSLAEAGELDLATAAETTVNAMKLFNLEGKEASSVADMLSTAANKTTADVTDFAEALKYGGSAAKLAGYSLNETVTGLEALAESGVKGTMAGTTFKTALIQLLKPTTKQSTVQKELGLQILTSNGHLKNAAELSKELRIATEGMTKAERTKALATLGGQRGLIYLNALYEKSPKLFEEFERANAKQGTAQEIAAKKMDNFAGKWEQFKGSLETAEIQIYKGIAPALDTLAEEGERAANKVGDIFSNENLDTGEKLEKLADFAGQELGKLWDEAEIPRHATEAFAAAAPVVAEAAAHTAVLAAEEFGKAFIHAAFIAKVAMGAWLINFIGGKQAFVGIAKLYGRQFGLGFTREAEASMAASAPAVVAESKAIAAASAQAAMSVPAAIPVARQSSFVGPGTGAARKAATEGALLNSAFDTMSATNYLGIPDLEKELAVQGKAGSRAFIKNFASDLKAGAPAVASSVASMGGRLVQGAATWGLGGYVVGQTVKELGDSHTATVIGDALQGAGIGAAIGSAIPLVGTALGAAAGGAGGSLFGLLSIDSHEAQERGEEYGEAFLKGWLKDAPRREKLAQQGFLGASATKKRIGDPYGGGHIAGVGLVAESTGFTYRSGSGLRGERSKLEDRLESTKLNKGQKAAIEAEVQAISKAIRGIEKDRLEFKGVLARMSGDALSGVGQINKDLKSGLSKADSAWGHGTKAWRQHAVEAMKGAKDAIKDGMDAGVISADAGQKRINALLRKIKLVSGKDPAGIAEGVAKSFKEAGQITSGGVKGLIHDLDAMPKGARIKGIESIEGMTRAWAQGHPKLEKQVDLLTQNIKNKFGNASKAVEQGQAKSLQHIVEANTGASSSVAEALTSIGANLTSALKALGAHNLVEFKITKEAQAFHHRQGGGPIPGTFTVPGSGSGDKVPMMLPPGSFIENREAARLPFQAGGMTPVILEPKERVWLPPAVNQVGAANLHARNAAFPRFQKGGETGSSGSLPHPILSGPEPLRGGAQKGVDRTWKAANKYLRAHSMPPQIRAALHAAEAISAPGFGYDYGGGHGNFAIQPVDCSGLDSYVLHAGHFINAPMSVQQGSGLYTLGESGPGKWLTWGVRGTSGANAHTMISLKALANKWRFFESGGSFGGGGGAREVPGWDGNFQFRHMPGFQQGGQVPEKAKDAITKYGQDAFNPKSKHFVGWGYQRGGLIPKFATGGFAKGDYTVKHQPASGQQKHTAAEILEAADQTHALQPPRVAALMAATQESNMGSTGNTFQLTGTFEGVSPSDSAMKQAVQWFTKGYYTGPVLGAGGGIEKARKSHNLGLVAQEVEGSAYPGLYSQWESEGRNWAEGWGGKHQNAKEEKEHTYKEEVPAFYKGCSTKTLHFPSVPKNKKGLEREINHWSKQEGKYAKAIKAAKKDNRPGLVQDLQHNVADIANHLRDLRNELRNVRVEAAKSKFSKLLKRKFSKLTGYETAIEQAQQAYEKRGQFAEQVVDLEPLQPELPSEPEFPEQAKGESDKTYETKRRDAHNAYEVQREAAEKAFVSGLDGYIGGKEKPAYEAVLGSEADWRTKILEAERFAAGDWQKSNALGGFEGRFEDNIVTNVENQLTMKEAVRTLTEEIKAWKQKVADWRNDSSNNGKQEPKWIKRLEGDWEDAEGKRDTILHEKLPIARSKETGLRETLGQARELFYPGKAGGGRAGAEKYFELLSNPAVPAIGSGSFEESLRDVQGIHWPDQHEVLKALPANRVAGSFGGAIWETQGAIEELGLKVNQANGSVQKAVEEGPGNGGGEDSGKSELTELEKEELLHYRQRDAIKAALEPVISQFNQSYPVMPPYAGKAHTGAIVPGPPNAERTMVVKAREGIFTEEQMAALGPVGTSTAGKLTVHVNGDIHQDPTDPRDPVEVFTSGDRRIDAHIEQVASRTRRPLSGGGGAGRAWRP